MREPVSHNFKSLSRLEIAGGGQITVQGNLAFVGHMDAPDGTTIIDVADPRNPKIVAKVMMDDPWSHSHKVRVTGDLMVVNHEQNRRHFHRKGEGLVEFEREYGQRNGRNPSDAEIADYLRVSVADIPTLRESVKRGYHTGGYRVYDISDPSSPRRLCHVNTHGFGVHRFDIDDRYFYMSTEMPGFVGNILVIYDHANPSRPEEVGRWWMPEQENFDGARPTWKGYDRRLHHTMRVGDTMWASCWHGGFRVVDASDIRAPKTIGSYDYHPPGLAPTHTVLPLRDEVDGRRYAAVVDEEHSHRKGQLPAHMWFFDVTDLSDIRPVSTFHVSELDTPWAAAKGRFGAHQFQEVVRGQHLFVAWFSGGLRAIDVSDPRTPIDAGCYIPAPTGGHEAPQSNDVFEDERGLVYLIDRQQGLDILEFTGR